jgi:uncharacterized phage-associated protein
MNLTKEAFDEWKEHPVTKEVFSSIKAVKHELLSQVSTGATLGQSADVTHGLTNRMIGHVEGLDQLLNITFTDSEEDSD